MGYYPLDTILHPLKVSDSYAGIFRKAAQELKVRTCDQYGQPDQWPETEWNLQWPRLDEILLVTISKLTEDVAVRILKDEDPDAINRIIGSATSKLTAHWVTWLITGIQPRDDFKPCFSGTWMHAFDGWIGGKHRDIPLVGVFKILGLAELLEYTGLTGDSEIRATLGLAKLSKSSDVMTPAISVVDIASDIHHVWAIR